jgi:PAS domain S-box-containing protein
VSAEFRALVEHAPDGIVVSRDGVVLYANLAAAKLLGHDAPEDLIGKPMTFLDRQQAETMRRRIQQMKERGETLVPREYPAKRKDGTEIIAEIASTIVEFDGKPAVLAYARDATERSRLRAQLAHSDRLASLGMLAAGVAHEINNPLAFTSLAAEMLQKRVAPAEQPLLENVRSGLDRIASIVRDLRFFGRYDDELPGAVDLAIAIETAERLVAHELRPRARLVKDFGELPPVFGVARRIEQVFVNLFLNAAIAVEPRHEGSIVVTARVLPQSIVVNVRDDGVGIAPDKLEAIFEPFVTTRPSGGGTGLGLSICRDILVRTGGNIVASSVLGEGTTMEVTFARAERTAPAHATIPAPPPAMETRATSKRILVVDDEPLIVSSLVSALSVSAQVVGETNPETALTKLLAGEEFDAIVCDVMMPGLTGTELHERVVRERPALASRFIFITGGTYTGATRDYLERVPNLRLAKPFAMGDLVRAIESPLT